MKKITIMDTIILLMAAALIIFTLMPAVARMQRSSTEAKCQSNMCRWAQAIAIYTTENGNRYPTNRSLPGMTGRVIKAAIKLSPQGIDPATGKAYRGANGTCWVEALYPYIIETAQKTGQDWQSFMKCPKASNVAAPNPTGTITPSPYIPGVSIASALTYALNYNLVEQPKWAVRNPEKLMMIREMDRLVDSVLRPTNMSNGTSTIIPDSPFLSSSDSNKCINTIGQPFPTESRLHGNGSHIVFADGHVRYFDASYYPNNIACWDASTQQWYNYIYTNPSNDTERMLNKSIAITL